MKQVTAEWVAIAEADLRSAARELRARRDPNFDAACFFSQQCIEKYLKAILQEAGISFSRTHDLEALANQVARVETSVLLLMPVLKPLTAYAVAFRYPGRRATRTEAREAINHAKKLEQLARMVLNLNDGSPSRHGARQKPRRHATAKKRGKQL